MATPHHTAPPTRHTPQDTERRQHIMSAASGALGDSVRVVAPRSTEALLSQGQRDGRECVGCGSTTGPFTPCGHVNDDGLTYAVVTCPSCPRHAASLVAHQ
ncbi:hypothetical protein [Kitasatospora sp. NPDC002965]|uniref:hypothetical protein n=1 Tax=Kitasatospora sp. NPDC002965 TaxID=3154775 RepID=UPI00339FE0AC